MHDQMTINTAFNELTANILAVETKPYMRATLQAALVGLDFPAEEAASKLDGVYGPRTLQ